MSHGRHGDTKDISLKVHLSTCLDMLYLSNLMYQYGETIEPYVERKLETIDTAEVPRRERSIINHLKNECPDANVILHIDDSISGLQCVVTICESTRRITVIFRGTESIIDWVYDVTLCKIRVEGLGDVHRGFNQLLTGPNLYAVLAAVDELTETYPTYDVYMTGHSLGGALATLCAAKCAKRTHWEHERQIRVVTFGSPRVGNLSWQTAFSLLNILHVRFTNNCDVVTVLPSFNFYHTGEEIHLHGNRISIRNEDTWFFYRFSISDHSTREYINSIRSILSLE